MNSSLMTRVNHIVVVMLENRSFDHMLGYLYADTHNVSPRGHTFEGLTGKESNPDGKGGTVSVYPIRRDHPNTYTMPGADPGEGFLNTNLQLFNTQTPTPGSVPTNQGFLTNFAATLAREAPQPSWHVIPGTKPHDIMGMYTPELLPVLSGLAMGYAVCDHWYGSAPTETFPNRAFSQMGTSQGYLSDHSASVFTAPSIFTALSGKGATWSVYGYDAPPLTRGSVADITHAPESHFGEFADFRSAAQSGTLANYVFLEPQWGAQGSSQHPNYNVAAGEHFLLDIYTTLRSSKIWPETLLIITYDEHGGCYDHVPPPENAVPPDDIPGEYGFDFKRFGPRVPTILISPLIEAGTVYRSPVATPFDHTSVLATLEKRFGMSPLTRRDGTAPDVWSVLTRHTHRTDDPLEAVKPPQVVKQVFPPAAPTHIEVALASSAAALPTGDTQLHQPETPPFTTGEEAVEYARRRYAEYAATRKTRAHAG